LAFYNVGCDEPKGRRRLIVPLRRALRRVLRPFFLRQVEIFSHLCDRLDAAEAADLNLRRQFEHMSARQDDLADQAHAAVAFGWDYMAMVRRLAALEDRVEALSAERDEAMLRPDRKQQTLPFAERDGRPRALAS
jgi:hypothetical protein